MSEEIAAYTPNIGEIVTFKAYGELQPGVPAILVEGEAVTVTAAGADPGAFEVASVEDPTRKDTVFAEELEPQAEAEAEAAPEPPKPAPRARPVAAKPAAPAVAKPAAAPVKPAAAPAAAKPAAKPAAAPVKAAAPAAAKPAAAAPAAAKSAAKPAAKAAAAPAAKPAAAQAAAPAPEKAAKTRPAKAPVAPAAPEPPAVVIPDSAAVTAVIEANGNSLDAAVALLEQAEQTYFDLGGVLSHIKREGDYKSIMGEDQKSLYDGNEGFAKYVKDDLGLDYRKAMYLIEIYEHFIVLGDEVVASLGAIGWSKAKELTKIATAANVNELITYATAHNKEEVIAFVKQTKATTPGGPKTPPVVKTRFQFALHADAGQVVKQALENAGTKIGSTDLNEQLKFIVTEWLALQDGAEVDLGTAMEALGQRYGVELGVIEPEAATETAAS